METNIVKAETIITNNLADYSYNGFVYSKKYVKECSEMELTMTIIYASIAALALVGIVAGIFMYNTYKYKKELYQLVGDNEENASTELQDMGILNRFKKCE